MICGTTTGSLADFDNEVANANFLYPSNGAEGPLLVVSVTSLSGAVVSSSTFCAVPLSAIDASARSMFNYCANNYIQLQFPWTNTGPCSSTANIKECDLELFVSSFVLGPGKLATQRNNPLSGFEVIHESQPCLLYTSPSPRDS